MAEADHLSVDELRSLFLFEHLSPEQLEWLQRDGWVVDLPAGPVYAEGEAATCFYVLLEGTVAMSRRVGETDVETTRTSARGVYAGAWQSFIHDRGAQTYTGSLVAVEPSRFFVVDADVFARMVSEWFPMAQHLLEGLYFGLQNQQQRVAQRERLLALGSLSAGLTHELNNPSAAAVRAVGSLRDRVAGMRHKLGMIAAGPYTRTQLDALVALQEDAVDRVAKVTPLTPMEAADREDLLGDWLDDHGVPGGWELAPTFVAAGLDVDWLERAVDAVEPEIVEGAMRWIGYSVETELLMNEIQDSAERISSLVDAAGQYSQLDRAPFQRVDVHELLRSTLVMLSSKLGDGISVVEEFDPSLPQISAFAAELNQVWTNIIDNAIAAMAGHGTLTIRTGREGDFLVVEIADTGPGIPPDVLPRIFEPFFTTKPVGEGTGLGLDISSRIVVNKHHGDLQVTSTPGDTRFRVLLPLHPVDPVEPVEPA
jgi:signal transduction histidine kinase